YLFGASPAVCASFVEGRKHQLVELSPGTMYAPHATSLRMGPLGYQSDAQSALYVSYNDLESYSASLDEALTKPYPPYAKVGIREDVNYRQLSTSLLQIENEFYGSIRPKRRINSGERALHALRSRGARSGARRRQRASPCARRGTGGTARTRYRALGESARRDGAQPPELLRALRPRRVDAAQGLTEEPRAAARSARALQGPRRLVARAPARDRGRGQRALRGLAPEIPVARQPRRLGG